MRNSSYSQENVEDDSCSVMLVAARLLHSEMSPGIGFCAHVYIKNKVFCAQDITILPFVDASS